MRKSVLLSLLAALCTAALAGTIDIPDDVNARISRAKSEQSALASERARRKLDEADGAGGSAGNAGNAFGGNGCNISIGNVVEDNKKIGTSAKRETTVIVTGDIIQTGNNCR